MTEQSEEIQPTTKSDIKTVVPRKPLTRRAIKKQLIREKERATHDQLTKILNRAGFEEMYQREAARMKRSITDSVLHNHPIRKDSKAIIIYFDLNEFKQVNERFGHTGGDEELVRVAKTISEASRPTDIVARLGGDEFAMILPGNDIESGKEYWENILFPTLNTNNITVSAGACEFDPENPKGSIDKADKYQKMAKDASRNLDHATQIVFG